MSDNLLFTSTSHERSRFLPRISFALPHIRGTSISVARKTYLYAYMYIYAVQGRREIRR